jgi:flagellar biosynthetic protein FliS
MNIQQSYREATVQGASPVQLVIGLYEQMIEDVRQAAIAVEQKDIRQRTRHIKHAILVIGHLQSVLDFENGGKVARDLNNFYNVLRQSLLQVQFFPQWLPESTPATSAPCHACFIRAPMSAIVSSIE